MGALRALPGAKLIVTHSPDLSPRLPRDVQLAARRPHALWADRAAGHRCAGQEFIPAISCGEEREHDWTTIVTGGVGTSVLPVRFGAPPDMWVIRIGALPPDCDDGLIAMCLALPRLPKAPAAATKASASR